MKKFLILIAAIPLLASSLSLFAADSSSFTTVQQQEIGKIAAQYIIDHPDVLIKASQALQADQQKQMQQKATQTVVENAKELVNSPMSPVAGNPKGKVAIIEFYDYQCVFCHREFPIIESVLKSQKNVRYIAKMFPIFAQRWPASHYAAQMAFVASKQGKFAAYHDGIFSSGLDEGKLTKADIDKIAKKAGVNISALSSMQDQIKQQMDSDMELAMQLGFQGTPALIVMPVSNNPNPDQISVFFGYTQAGVLKAAIKKAQG